MGRCTASRSTGILNRRCNPSRKTNRREIHFLFVKFYLVVYRLLSSIFALNDISTCNGPLEKAHNIEPVADIGNVVMSSASLFIMSVTVARRRRSRNNSSRSCFCFHSPSGLFTQQTSWIHYKLIATITRIVEYRRSSNHVAAGTWQKIICESVDVQRASPVVWYRILNECDEPNFIQRLQMQIATTRLYSREVEELLDNERRAKRPSSSSSADPSR